MGYFQIQSFKIGRKVYLALLLIFSFLTACAVHKPLDLSISKDELNIIALSREAELAYSRSLFMDAQLRLQEALAISERLNIESFALEYNLLQTLIEQEYTEESWRLLSSLEARGADKLDLELARVALLALSAQNNIVGVNLLEGQIYTTLNLVQLSSSDLPRKLIALSWLRYYSLRYALYQAAYCIAYYEFALNETDDSRLNLATVSILADIPQKVAEIYYQRQPLLLHERQLSQVWVQVYADLVLGRYSQAKSALQDSDFRRLANDEQRLKSSIVLDYIEQTLHGQERVLVNNEIKKSFKNEQLLLSPSLFRWLGLSE